MVKFGSSQDVIPIEVIGTDTFPTVTTYNGVQVSVWTDSQTGAIAHMVEQNGFLARYNTNLDAANKQLESIVRQKNIEISAKQQKLDSASLALSESGKNERDLKTSLAASIDKTKAVKSKFILKMTTGTIFSFLAGSVGGTLVGAFAVKKK